MPSIVVRRFAPGEWRMYRDLRLRALSDSPDSFGSTYEREAVRGDADWQARLREGSRSDAQLPLVALAGEVPIGLAWARRDEHDPGVAHLFQVWVAPSHRGRGAGRLLTDTVIAWARGLGIATLRLGVTASHPAAGELYRSAGFVNAGEAECLRPGSPMMCQPMQLTLTTKA
jgi:ribosomal protein S18 acetylase RimI-like enzyme